MPNEIRRVGRRSFVQTPNRHFPVDWRTLVPFFHFLPVRLQAWCLCHLPIAPFGRLSSYSAALEWARHVRDLTRGEVKSLFPDSKVVEEKLWGLTKSFIAFLGFESLSGPGRDGPSCALAHEVHPSAADPARARPRLGFLPYGGTMRLLVMSMAVMGLLISECAAEYPPPLAPPVQFVQRHYDCRRSASRISDCAAEYPPPLAPPVQLVQRHYDCLRSTSRISDCAAEYPPPSTPQEQLLQDRYDCLRHATIGGQIQSYSLNPIVVPPSSNPNGTDPAPNEQDPRTAAPTVRQLYEAQLFQSCMAVRGYKLKQ